jgi:hypothetical protein
VVMEKRKHILGEEHPRHIYKHGKSCTHILKAGPIEGGRGTADGGDMEK